MAMAEKYDILGHLPIESTQEILMRISPEDLCNVSKCCKSWKKIIRGNYFWKKKSEVDYSSAGLEYMESECYRKYVQNFATPSQGHYMYNHELEQNWKNGVCRRISVNCMLDVESFVYMDDDMLIVAKLYEICIINISSGLIEKTIELNHLFDAVVEKSEGLLIVLCRHNFDINTSSLITKVWNLKTWEPMENFEHSLMLRYSRFWVHKHLIAFIHRHDRELCIFNMKTGNFDYQRGPIRTLCFGSDSFAIRTGVNVVEIMDLNFNVLMELTCCDGKFIHKIQMKKNYLFVNCVRVLDVLGSLFRRIESICVWDLTTKTKLYTIQDGQSVDLTFINENKIICLKQHLPENWLVSLSLPHFATQNIECVVIDEYDCKIQFKIKIWFSTGHKNSGWYMYTSNNRFLFTDITATSLKLRCPRTQKLIRSFDLQEFDNGRDFKCIFGQIDILLASNKNLAYVEKKAGNNIVHIMDFGPDIKNKRTFS